MKDLSIIIVNYRCWDNLSVCLDSLTQIAQTSFTFEVIIVDNASRDGKISEFRKNYVDYNFILNSGNYGFASGCNLGATYSRGKYLLFLNPDTIVSEKALYAMLDQVRVSKANSVVSCRQFTATGKEDKPYGVFPSPFTLTGWSRALVKLFHVNLNPPENKRFIFPDWISGSVFMISKSCFSHLGGWNEKFWMYFEDVDLCSKVRAAGGSIILMKDVSITHVHGGASRKTIETKVLTKAEVSISKHEYLFLHENGLKHALMQLFLIFNNLVLSIIPAFLGLVLFFNKKLFSATLIYKKLLDYYLYALMNDSWISPRSPIHANTLGFGEFTVRKVITMNNQKNNRA